MDRLTRRARHHFARLCIACIRGAAQGEFFVNDPPDFIRWKLGHLRAVQAGEYDHTFTFRQYRHYLETGVSVPFLPPKR